MLVRAVAVAAALAAVLLATACGGSSGVVDGAGAGGGAPDWTRFEIAPVGSSSVRGTAVLRQADGRLEGWIAAWGLDPGAEHGTHLHGEPEGRGPADCATAPTDRHVVDLDPLRADANGVAAAGIDIAVGEEAVRPGVYLMIHAAPGGGAEEEAGGGHAHGGDGPMPGVACGDLPGGPGTP